MLRQEIWSFLQFNLDKSQVRYYGRAIVRLWTERDFWKLSPLLTSQHDYVFYMSWSISRIRGWTIIVFIEKYIAEEGEEGEKEEETTAGGKDSHNGWREAKELCSNMEERPRYGVAVLVCSSLWPHPARMRYTK